MAPINGNDVKLMLAIIGSAENIKTDNEKLANIVGDGATANAIRQRVHKIKTQAKAVLEGNESPDIKLGGGKATPKKGANSKSVVSGDNDDEEVAPTPKKRAVSGMGKGTLRGKKAKEEAKEEEASEESPAKRMKTEDAEDEEDGI